MAAVEMTLGQIFSMRLSARLVALQQIAAVIGEGEASRFGEHCQTCRPREAISEFSRRVVRMITLSTYLHLDFRAPFFYSNTRALTNTAVKVRQVFASAKSFVGANDIYQAMNNRADTLSYCVCYCLLV